MANLVITNGCNLHCPFCFASEYRQEAASAQEMSWTEFCWQLDFINTDTVRFCGGEPTLHSQFTKMVQFILEKTDKKIFVMTNGLWPSSIHKFFQKLSRRQQNRLFFMVNVLRANNYTDEERKVLEKTLKIIASDHTTLAITIYNRHPNFDYHLDLIRRFNIKYLRYSLAAPNITDQRSWHFDPDRDFPLLGEILTELLKLCLSWGIYLQSDCGYLPLCYWPQEGQELLDRINSDQAEINFDCQGPLDIGPNGIAWRCFGLKTLTKQNSHHFLDCGELANTMHEDETRFQDHFLKESCRECLYRRQGKCGGGCLALRSSLALRQKAKQSGFDLANDIEILDCYLHFTSQLKVFTAHNGPRLYMLDHQEWEEMTTTGPFFTLLTEFNPNQSIEANIKALNLNDYQKNLLQQIRQLYAQGLITLGLNLPPS